MRVAIAIFFLMLAACSTAQWNDRLSTPADRAMALNFIAAMRTGTIATQQAVMEPKLFAQTGEIMGKAAPLLPKSGVPELVTVNETTFGFNADARKQVALNFQFGSDRKWALFQVVLQKDRGTTTIAGWNVHPFAVRPTTAGDFVLQGKSAWHYGWLAAMVASTATIVWALVLLFFTRGIRRRLLWALACAAGVVQFTLNWSTGEWGINPLYFNLLGSGYFRPSPFDPWYLTFSLPVGAVFFLVRRPQLLARIAAEEK